MPRIFMLPKCVLPTRYADVNASGVFMSSRTSTALIVCACMLFTMPTSQAMSAPTSQPTSAPTTQKLLDQVDQLQKRVQQLKDDPENALSREKKSSKPAPDPKTAPIADATSDGSA